MTTTPPCCSNLAKARDLPNSLIRTNDNGIELVSVGYDIVGGAYGWHDFPLMFCPSCGGTVQSHPRIAAMNGGPVDPSGGHCCRFRERAATDASHPTFVPAGGTSCLAVGFVEAGDGLALMELAVAFCPFCGKAQRPTH